MQDPLKQGLKPFADAKRKQDNKIRMQDPLKQGLKLYADFVSVSVETAFECKIH